MKRGLRVLITNNELVHRQGSELFVRDIALGLVRRGHCPVAYSTMLGNVADEMHRLTIPVIDNLESLQQPPDVIHAQHHLEAMTAMLRFPDVPVISYCHGWLPWQELPVAFPSIARYVAVDDLCRERLLTTPGVSADAVCTLYNFVDLRRFSLRSPLPVAPRTALIFGNSHADALHARCITAACRQAGIEQIDHVGLGVGKSQATPEAILGNYDVVFAKARCALEALACGCAVVVAEHAGIGGLVTPGNMAELRRLNFGVRSMQAQPMSEAGILEALSGYDPTETAAVTRWIRRDADLETYLDRLIALYHEAIQQTDSQAASHRSHLDAASKYLRSLAPLVKRHTDAEQRATVAEEGLTAWQQHAQALEQERLELLQRLTAADAHLAELQRDRRDCEARLIPLEQSARELRHIQASRSWKWLTRALAVKNRFLSNKPRRAA